MMMRMPRPETFRQRNLPQALERLSINLIRRSKMNRFECECGYIEFSDDDLEYTDCPVCGDSLSLVPFDFAAIQELPLDFEGVSAW